MQESFPERDARFDIEHRIDRGQPAVRFVLWLDGVCGDPIDSFGGGFSNVISIILRILSTIQHPHLSRVLFLDEPTANLGEATAGNFAQLLAKLCQPISSGGLGFDILLITHCKTISEYSHRHYEVSLENGKTNLELTYASRGNTEPGTVLGNLS